jgi:hypothetical protein
VLVDGDVGGLWRAAKKGKSLLFTVEPLGELPGSAMDEVAAEVERMASFRGAATRDLRIAAL